MLNSPHSSHEYKGMRPPFDLNLMRLLVALHEERSATRAAVRLGRSQPSVSHGLKKLRSQLGDPLFIRGAAGLEPTPRGHALAARWRDMIGRVDEDLAGDAPFDAAATRFTATFAMSDVGEIVFLPRILAHVRRLAPHCVVQTVSLPPTQLERGLESGEVDLAIGYFPDLVKNNFLRQQLFLHHFVCVLRAGHPANAPRLSLADFLALEHAVVHAAGRSQEIFERYLARRRVVRKVALLTPHFLSLPMILARSDLVATVPHAIGMYCEATGNQVRTALPPFEIPKIPVRQHWHRRFQSDPRNRWLRSAVRELFTPESDEWRGAEAR